MTCVLITNLVLNYVMKNKIYYRLEGTGPPLVFIHGILGFWRNFYSCSQAFRENYTCLLYDQRGHGRSVYKELYTVEQLAQDLKDLLDFLQWKPVVLVGHSLGGYVSFYFAHHYPEYVKKMIIVDSSPWPVSSQREKIEEILLGLPRFFPNRVQAIEFFKQSVENHIFSSAIAHFLMASLETNSTGTIKFLFDIPGLLTLLSHMKKSSIDYPSFVKSLKTPSLILRGEHSAHFLRSDFEKTLKLNPLIIGKEIKNSGHWIHSEQPQSFIKAVQDFLS